MKTTSNLTFIREKIYQIRSALMYSLSNELVKLPTNIVTILRLDEEGQLWFLSKRPVCYVDQCEQSFPARLVFYRKGISFSLEVSGKATIVEDETNIRQADSAEFQNERPVMMKMNMSNLEFTGLEEKRKKNRLDEFMENTYKWLAHTISFARHDKPILEKLSHAAQ